MIDLDIKDRDSNQQDAYKTRWILLVIPRGRSSLHDTDCNYVDDHAADVEDVGYPIRTGSFGDRETLVGSGVQGNTTTLATQQQQQRQIDIGDPAMSLLPTKRVCGSVGDLDRNVVRRDKRDCIFLKGDK